MVRQPIAIGPTTHWSEIPLVRWPIALALPLVRKPIALVRRLIGPKMPYGIGPKTIGIGPKTIGIGPKKRVIGLKTHWSEKVSLPMTLV